MSTTIAYDATTGNAGTMPPGQHAGYTTGPGVAWSQAQFDADPGALRICQDPGATDVTADVLDVESGAATVADVVPWYRAALHSYLTGVRPGQRHPAVYCARNTLTSVANAFVAAGISGVPIWIAEPGLTTAQAAAIINAASGPFPELGVQNAWFSTYDEDVFQSAWLTAQSGKAGQTVAIGNSGPAVQAAQSRLNVWSKAKGTNPVVTVDGLFGALTQSAVKSFQSAMKLTADGVVGPLTWAALDKNPVLPSAPLSVTAVHTPPVAATYALAVKRGIPGYTGKYSTVVTETGKLIASDGGTAAAISFPLPGPGTYVVVTSADGYAPSSYTVNVLAA